MRKGDAGWARKERDGEEIWSAGSCFSGPGPAAGNKITTIVTNLINIIIVVKSISL